MLEKIVNIAMGIGFLFVLYVMGSIPFGYDIPEFIIHHPTTKELQVSMENHTLPIKFKDLEYIVKQRDSLRLELDKCKGFK